MEELEFGLRDGVDRAYRRGLSVLQFDFEVVRPVRIERIGSFLVEDVQKVVVFFRDRAEVDGCIGDRRAGLCSHLREGKLEDFGAVHPADASECSCIDESDFWCFELWSCFTGIGDWCCQRGRGLPWAVEEVGDAWKRISVFLGDFVERSKVGAETE